MPVWGENAPFELGSGLDRVPFDLNAYKSSNKSSGDADHRRVEFVQREPLPDSGSRDSYMTIADLSKPSQTPALFRALILIVCAITALSALPWMWMSLSKFGGFAWGVFGFELMVLLGCVMTMLVCLGKVKVGSAFPLAITCLSGTILVGAVFGLYVDARAVVGDNPDIQPWINRTILLRLSAIALFTLVATLDVYRRDVRSWGLVVRAAVFLLPVVAALGWIKVKGFPEVASQSGELSPVKMIVVLVLSLVVGILMSVGGHFLIRSFEIALPEHGSEPGTKTGPEKITK